MEVTTAASKVWCCLTCGMGLARSLWALGGGETKIQDETKLRKGKRPFSKHLP